MSQFLCCLSPLPSRSKKKNRTLLSRKIANLDPELLLTIFNHLQSRIRITQNSPNLTLLRLCLICKGWLQPARAALYRRIWATSLPRALSLHHALVKHPELRGVVRYFEIPAIWTGVDHTSGVRLYSFSEGWRGDTHDRAQLGAYLDKMKSCALACPRLEEVRTCADSKYLTASPPRAPRVDRLLDLSHTHRFLLRLHLDDGGLHKSTIYDVFPHGMKLDHLEELTLRNYAFVSTPTSLLFRGTTTSSFFTHETTNRIASMPRLRTLRLIHCTSDDHALLPLTSQISRSLVSLTIIQRKDRFLCSEEGNSDSWHAAFSQKEVFAPLSRTIQHLSLSMDFYRPAYFLSYSNLRAVHLRARTFHRAGVIDLPTTVQHVSITVLDPAPDWAFFHRKSSLNNDSGGTGQYDLFDDLANLLSLTSLVAKVTRLRMLDLNLPEELRRSVRCWIQLRTVQLNCRRGRVLLRIRMRNSARSLGMVWGEELRGEGRDTGHLERIEEPGTPSKASPSTSSGFLKSLHMGI